MEPLNEAELADSVAGLEGPVRIEGGGTRPIGHVADAPVLSSRGMRGIILYEPGALTLVAQAGTPLVEVEAALAAERQRLAFEPMDHRPLLGTTGEPTLGGMVAGNVSGPRRIQVGACRDFLLGVRFVDGRGQIIRNGGRVMKNVTGYDLVKLMAGSHGTLGMLTEVALKVLPVPETQASVTLHGLTAGRAVKAMAAALGSPYEVTGAAHVPHTADDEAQTVLRLEGTEASVIYRTGRLQSLLADYGEISIETAEASHKMWSGLLDVTRFAKMEGDVWRVSLKPTDAPALLEQLGESVPAQLDWGGGLVWLLCPAGCGVGGQQIRAALAGLGGGHATLIRGDAPEPFQPLAAPLAALQTGLRARFDPRGLFNPGRMGKSV